MMLLLKRNLSFLLLRLSDPKTHLTSSLFNHFPRTLLHFSTSTIKNSAPKSQFIIEYLINSCGFSSEAAKKASKYISHIKSPAKPDSVRHFFSQIGLDDTQIRKLIAVYPRVLCSSIEETMKPKLRILQESAFSSAEIVDLVCRNSLILRTRNLQPKIEFWRGFFSTHESLLKALRVPFLLSCDLCKKIRPNIAILRECGIPASEIEKLILRNPSSIGRSPERIKVVLNHAEELGVCRTSGMFMYLFHALANLSRATIDAKIDMLKSLGWSEEEVLTAIRRTPYLLRSSEEKTRKNMEFLVKEMGCDPSVIAISPVLLLYSLNRRLIPRCYVLRVLKSEGLLEKDLVFHSAIHLSESRFLHRFVLPYEGKLPKLHEAYVAACAGGVPTC